MFTASLIGLTMDQEYIVLDLDHFSVLRDGSASGSGAVELSLAS